MSTISVSMLNLDLSPLLMMAWAFAPAEITVEVPRSQSLKAVCRLSSEDSLQTAFKLWLRGTSTVISAGANAQAIISSGDKSKFNIDTLMVDMFQPSLDYAKKIL